MLEATVGGTKRHLLELASGLRRRGWDVEVACPRVRAEAHGDVSFWDDLRAAGVPAHAVPMTRVPRSGANVAALLRLARLIALGHYAIVHAHSSIAGALARPAALIAWAATRRRPKLVYTPHGFAFLTPIGRRQRQIFLAAERSLGAVTNRVIALSPSEASATVAHRVARAHRVVTIPNGILSGDIPSREDRAQARARLGWDQAPVIGTISRMTPQKDPSTWLAAAAAIARARPDARFAWIWGGELEAQTRAEAARLGVEGRIDFLGYRQDARQLLAAFDVFLLTSIFEGLPYSLIEAMAAGTPVVATDVLGTRDVVRLDVTGLLAPAGDAEALAGHVLRLLNDPHLAQRLATNAREDVLGRYSVERMVEQTAAVYESLLA